MHDLEEGMIQRAGAITVDGRCCHTVEALACTGIGRDYLPASESEWTTWWLLLSYAVIVSLSTTYVDTMFPAVRCCIFDVQLRSIKLYSRQQTVKDMQLRAFDGIQSTHMVSASSNRSDHRSESYLEPP